MKHLISICIILLISVGSLLPTNPVEAAYSPTKVVNTAKHYIGTPYRWGGTTPKGFDCSGFVGYTFKKVGKNLPRTAAAMYKKGKHISKSKLKTGDLVFFHTSSSYKKTASHVAIYIGHNKVIHSVSQGVKIDSLNNVYWKKKYIGARRIN
ncbi:C40 family peptidase [Bacillus ginsengihumi]|uniref:C40 family peptidase n=2 Tax=Heyndrickxia ginsengihumi TaxID=363870 RepID=A0A0A6VDD7_9BACI|nr:C40 family peptidase [Heyndrickxia ginsengihumi]KHD85596.1 peptidase P60 [Heyndrickxia ginsengihumi]MBE6182880.1 NlpC/P60 family protein [Bacillus sp. (in: firmicutes)]MCM3023898.1 C40 family peptidase [Heyndrickxia ginsengihumi]NEY19871.1 C40 family peptidase [Heyndrickxia ginsengihumi]